MTTAKPRRGGMNRVSKEEARLIDYLEGTSPTTPRRGPRNAPEAPYRPYPGVYCANAMGVPIQAPAPKKRTRRKATVFDRVSEREWQAEIIAAVRKLYGNRALVYHTFDSRRSDAGFPDLVIWLPITEDHMFPRLLILECKTEKGKVTPAQEAWITAFETLTNYTSSVEGTVAVVRPSDKEEVWRWLAP